MKRAIAVGHTALDRIYRIEAFPPTPTKVRASEHVEAGGGMAANAAATFARLGGEIELWSRVGDDEAGARIRQLLTADRVDATFVRAFPGGRSSTSAIIVDAQGERLIVGHRDAGIPIETGWLPLDRVRDASIVLGDLRWTKAVTLAFHIARSAGVPTLLDADLGGTEDLPGLLPVTDYAIFADPALEVFATGATLADKLEKVLRYGVRHAGVTRGSAGYTWMNAEGEQGFQPAFKVDVVDTTGAGDAFHGAFAWAITQGCGEAECARIASAVAAMKCRKLGGRAGLPTKAELTGFLTAAQITPGALDATVTAR